MLGTSAVQQYFAGNNSHYINPLVSFEWNYNLFYSPYVTLNGPSAPVTITSSWTALSGNTISAVSSGRSTSVYLNDSGQTTRSCMSLNTINGNNIKDSTGTNYVAGFGDASITLSEITSTTNSYKITFWAKVDRDAVVNLSALAYIDSHRAHSSSKTIDNVMWTKFEIYLNAQPLGTAYSSPVITLHHGATDGTQTYGVLIDQFEIHQTSDFEYKYGNLWDTSAPFGSFRPGESFIPSGNSLCQLPANFRKIKTDLGIDSGSTTLGSVWNNQTMPVSPVLYHPTLLGTNSSSFNPIFKNGSLSEWSRYKYFVADTSTPTISGVYDQLLNVNKIIIKFNTSYAKPSSFTVTLSGKTNTYSGGFTSVYSYTATYSGSDIDSSGTCILYYNSNGSWLSGSNGGYWTGTTDTVTVPGTPSFDSNGSIKFGGSKGGTVNATVQINSIQVTQNSATVNSSYTAHTSVNENIGLSSLNITGGATGATDQTNEFKRMQVVEISPRLEVDVSSFTVSVSTQAELDNKQNPLPISQISSNMATVVLTNIPYIVNNKVLSIFSNNSTDSVLAGLFKNYVKCYINYRILDTVVGASSSDLVIPGGVFYVDTWDMTDIEKTTVTAYDISKYLQLVQPTDYVSQTEDGFRLISNILDFAGFTDYDYDSLKRVTSSVYVTVDGKQKPTTAPIRVRYFYADGTQQKLFDVLREIFEAYQIAAYVDAYGVMKFINIDGIFDSSNPISMQLHDTTAGVSVSTSNGYVNNLTIAPNIVMDSYVENTRTKVGKVTLTYKTPQIQKTIASDPILLNNDLYVDYAPTFMNSTNAIWDSTVDDATTYNTLSGSIKKSDTFFFINSNEAKGGGSVAIDNFRSYSIDHDGYGIIENEIVSFQYKEFAFTPKGSNSSIFRSILNSSDYAAQFAEVSGLLGNQSFDVSPTGRITNVNRGQFNTPVSSHLVMSSLADIQTKFDTSALATAPYIDTTSGQGNIAVTNLPANTNGSIIYALDTYTPNTYNTFSTKVLAGPNSNTNYPSGCSYGLILSDKSNKVSVVVYIQQYTNVVSGVNVPQYLLYVKNNITGTTLLSQPYIDITSIINSLATYSLNAPFSDYGKFLNIRFVKGSGSKTNCFEVYVNNIQMPITTLLNLNLDVSGKYGMFVLSNGSASTTVQFSEIYATQTAILNPAISYHYQLPWFAEKIASNKKIFEISYMAQSAPTIVGINYYDVQDTQAPSLDAFPLKLSYDWYFYPDGIPPKPTGNTSLTTAQVLEQATVKIVNDQIVLLPTTGNVANLPRISVGESSLSYSPVYHSGFRSRFAIVNCSPSQVWLKCSPTTLNKINVDFSLITNSLITLGDDVVIEKVFDVANINETVDIKSSWIQDKNTATGILKTIHRALEGFSRTTTVSVYGNPLYEIGDVVVVNYALKNIVNQKYIIQGITQSFEGGLTTSIVLNQIASDATVTSAKTYVAPGVLNGTIPSVPTPVTPVPVVPASVFSISGTTGAAGAFSLNWTNAPTGTASYTVTINGTNSSSLSPSATSSFSTPTSGASYTGATAGATYNVFINAYTSGGATIGSASTTVVAGSGASGSPGPGSTLFTVTPTTGASGAFSLLWQNAPTGTTNYTHEAIGLGGDTLPNSTQGTTASYTNLVPGASYAITVKAFTSGGAQIGIATNTAIAGGGAGASGFVVNTTTGSTSGTFNISWQNAPSNTTSYGVTISSLSASTSTLSPNKILTGIPLSTTSESYVGATDGGQYDVTVYAYNGGVQVSSATNKVIAGSTIGTTILPFNAAGTTGTSPGTFTVYWANPPSGTVSYDIVVMAVSGNILVPFNSVLNQSTSLVSKSYSGATPGGTYQAYIYAYSSTGAILQTAVAKNIIACAAPALPGLPTVTFSNITTTSFTVNFNASDATSYYVDIFNNSGFQSLSGYPKTVAAAAVGQTSIDISGLPATNPGTQYNVALYGINSVGIGTMATGVNVTTVAASTPGSSFTATATQFVPGAFFVNWSNPPTGTASYGVTVTGPNTSGLIPSANLTGISLSTLSELYTWAIIGGTYSAVVTAYAANGTTVLGTAPTNAVNT